MSCDEKDISALKILGKMLDEDKMMAEEREKLDQSSNIKHRMNQT